ncbi:lipid A-modifier LpxR family protein [Bizionia sediminis]|uniref:Lipid A-modifier LpxR family protein n=1 Tax=Bizionia sediminis TaxID=1737064 RepID=A0ABW5KS30_9FLAO
MTNTLLRLCIAIIGMVSFAQNEPTYKYELELATDNDYFVIYNTSDRNYTYGVAGRFRWISANNQFLSALFASKKHHSYTVGLSIEAYTPNYRKNDTETSITIERPYAGWSYAVFESNYSFKHAFFRFGLELGILGPASQAGAFQNYIHEHITQDALVDWSEQIPNQLGINLTSSYAHELFSFGFFDGYASAQASVGTILTYVWPKIHFRLGKFNTIGSSVSGNNGLFSESKKAEWFLDYGMGFKLSGYNATIQGNVFQGSPEKPSQQINHYIVTAHATVMYSYQHVTAAFGLNFNTGEFDRTKNHAFGSLRLLYRF